MAPRRGKKAAATVVDEIAAPPPNDPDKVNSTPTKADKKKIKATKEVEPVEQNNVVVEPAKAEAKSKKAAPKKNVKQIEPKIDQNDGDTNGESALPVTADANPKRGASKRIAKRNDAAAQLETVEAVNGAANDAKKANARGKKKIESPKMPTPKVKSKKVETKKPDETKETGSSTPNKKKNAKAKQTKQPINDQEQKEEEEEEEEDVNDETVVPVTKTKRGARKAAPVVETEQPTKGRAKKVADTTKSTAKPTKSKVRKEEPVIADTVLEDNATDGRKRKSAKVDADKSPAKKKKNTVVGDTVDGVSTSKDSSKKRKVDTNVAADSTTNDTNDELVTKRKKPSKKVDKEQAKSKMNPSTSDLSQVNFNSDKEFQLKIVSWNVAGLRALIAKDGFDYFEHEKPDIICLQEIKCLEDEVPAEAKLKGYHPYWCSTPGGRGGVAILSKSMPYNVEKNIGNEEMDEEGRIITAEYSKFFLVCVYVPNAGRKLVNLDRRLRWNKLFEQHLKNLKAKKPVIICGDMNVAHEEIDLANPKTNRKNAGFSDEERAGMDDLLQYGFIDTFRELNPTQEKAYTFWTYMGNARAKNVGWRLDYSIVSENLKQKVVDSFMRPQILGSDHCPIVLLMNI